MGAPPLLDVLQQLDPAKRRALAVSGHCWRGRRGPPDCAQLPAFHSAALPALLIGPQVFLLGGGAGAARTLQQKLRSARREQQVGGLRCTSAVGWRRGWAVIAPWLRLLPSCELCSLATHNNLPTVQQLCSGLEAHAKQRSQRQPGVAVDAVFAKRLLAILKM